MIAAPGAGAPRTCPAPPPCSRVGPSNVLRGRCNSEPAVTALDPGEPVVSVVDADKHASIGLHLAVGFTQTERVEEYAGVTFEGGRGVVMVHEPAPETAGEPGGE